MLYSPDNPPFFLDFLQPEAQEDDARPFATGKTADASARSGKRQKGMLVRYLLLILGAEAFLVAGFYFFGIF